MSTPETDRLLRNKQMRIVAAMLMLISYGLTFWAGGAFTLAVMMIDREGGLTPESLMEALAWPVSYAYWLVR